ncbi:MAG: hypothetical protein J0I34_07340 [Pseudonocardia sp.]|uniref:hypothetical protein n=1 Tax=Actinomycetes TaxID=1760 RepID=UPI00086A84AC|nr:MULTISPECIES: hypothetical protein [Actinomycetes]MBN9108581.1 hypothetical protein [Pseudonocardia sp.]ODU27460.1 MAG: hypothetical protein ABS80_03525 [Pseudonocardia sp. SCN 72-51]ODV07778.1 MAG: hypothetical protein ABT15_06795 [Pseudonocardia sp. SCN 73-27]
MTEQQAEPNVEQPEAKHIVVILTDGTVANWPAETTAFTYQDDGPLTLYTWDPETEQRGVGIAAFARGQWAACYDDTYLAS